ncbi:GGDEF domain-containing protein [Colwellia piezophila]|uniref:GGDEF domain-containing protein n=1 Tax=Colwellia piezophila TaxID=211668 RepID=UPI00036F46FB|nr:GGDEF domain-containing protein [Colwellia piezophila]
MQKVKDTRTNKAVYPIVTLIILSAIIIALLYLDIDIDKHKIINLSSAEVSTVDDRTVLGSSIASVVKTNHGIEFSCQIKKSHLEQPFCQLVINIENLSAQSPLNGVDLSGFEQIGLWIEHNHPTQPGTRIELRNFNAAYSEFDKSESLKPNSVEYLEAFVTNPVWLNLSHFSIPQWWNNIHNLSLTNGGTDFSNIYSITLAPSLTVQEGSYKLTVNRIVVKGKYITSTTLITLLIAIWCLAIGYFMNRSGAQMTESTAIVKPTKPAIVFGAMSCPVTGALNRIGLRKCFDQLAPTDLNNLSVIFLTIDSFEDLYSTNGQQIADIILNKFVSETNNTCRSSDTVARWSPEAFLLVCPDTALEQAVEVADKIRSSIQRAEWPNNIKITCSAGVAQMDDEDLNDLITRANRAAYKASNSGRNKTAAA